MSNQSEGQISSPPVAPAPQTNTKAIISLVTGILAWTGLPFIGGIVAIITGYISRKEIKKSGGRISGDGMAIAGIVLGWINIIVMGVFGVCWLTIVLVSLFGGQFHR